MHARRFRAKPLECLAMIRRIGSLWGAGALVACVRPIGAVQTPVSPKALFRRDARLQLGIAHQVGIHRAQLLADLLLDLHGIGA
jgi:hypothetical protein